MEVTSRFNNRDFEVWIDHFQYLDIGERHQSVPSGKSYIRGTFDPDQDAYVIDKIHIDPDMLRTDVKEDLLDEAKLQAHKRDKRLLRKKRVAIMSVARRIAEPRMRLERDQPEEHRPMVMRDLQTTIWRIADSLARSLKDPQGSTPGDARWTVSGLSHSSWAINHPDIMTDGDSPLTLRIKKLPDGRWAAFGQNRLTNLLNTKILAIKKTPPGGDDWDDIDNFANTAATYFQEQKANIMSLKQTMTPGIPPGAGYNAQQGGGEAGGGMSGGGMGGMMASRRARRRKAADVMTPQQAMIALQMTGTGDVAKDKANLRAVMMKSHPDKASGPQANIRMQAAQVLNNTYIRNNKPLPMSAAQAQTGQGAAVGGAATAGQVNQKVQGYVSQAVNGATRLSQSLSTLNAQVSSRAAVMNINKLNDFMNGAEVTVKANLGTRDPRAQGLYQGLVRASGFLRAASAALTQAGPQVNQQVLAEVAKNLNGFIQMGTDALNSTKQAGRRRAFATLDNLRKAQRIARQIHRAFEDHDWYLGVRVINDRDGIGLGVGAAEVPPRSLRSSLGGIPVFLEGPGGRLVRAQQERQKHRRLARKLAQEVADGMGILAPSTDPAAEKELKHHQRLVKRVYNHIKNNKRLSGSVRYLSRKLGLSFDELVKVIGQLIVEGKIEITKKKKFKPLPEPHTPIPGMAGKFASTNSVYGIDRGRSDKRVDQLLSQSNFQLNLNEPADATHRERDIRERPSKLMPDPTSPN